jgi:hypothetical protein
MNLAFLEGQGDVVVGNQRTESPGDVLHHNKIIRIFFWIFSELRGDFLNLRQGFFRRFLIFHG